MFSKCFHIPFLPGAVPSRAGELGELDPLCVRGGLRAAPRQDGHAAPPPGRHLQAREEHRVGESQCNGTLFLRIDYIFPRTNHYVRCQEK